MKTHPAPAVTIRTIRREDIPAVRDLHRQLDERDTYLRFFAPRFASMAKLIELLLADDSRHCSIGAFNGTHCIGVANYVGTSDNSAEVAIAVASGEHHHGVGTILMERLAEIARDRGVGTLYADVLAENDSVLHMVNDARWPVVRELDGTVVHLSIDLDQQSPRYSRDSQALRQAAGLSVAGDEGKVSVSRPSRRVQVTRGLDAHGEAGWRATLVSLCGVTAIVATANAIGLLAGVSATTTELERYLLWHNQTVAALIVMVTVALPMAAAAILCWKRTPSAADAAIGAGTLALALVVIQIGVLVEIDALQLATAAVGLMAIYGGFRYQHAPWQSYTHWPSQLVP